MFPASNPGARMDMMTGANMAAMQGGKLPPNVDLSKFASMYGKPMPAKAQAKEANPGAQAQDERKMRQALARAMGKPAAMSKTLTPEEVDAHVEEIERMKEALFGGTKEPEGDMEPNMGANPGQQPQSPSPFG